MSLSHAGIRVKELERSVRFYTEGLGMRERQRGTMSHGGVWVLLADPATQHALELNWYPPGSRYDVPFVPGEGLNHIGCEVDDVRGTIRHLLTKGGELAVEPWVEEKRYLFGFVADPDGNLVEVQGPAVPPSK